MKPDFLEQTAATVRSSHAYSQSQPTLYTMAKLDVDRVLEELSLNEKVSLLSGKDFWHTTAIPRLSIPSLRLSDGPNGIRGTHFFNSTPAACLPCGTALGATWNEGLIQELGILLANEAKAKGVHVILGPTVNMQRSPIGGRGFESFAEDPVLSGMLASAYCNSIEGQGIATTIKHFLCNDQEDKRTAIDVKVSDRALREIYLLPFMLAVREGNPSAFMTAYNKINGTHVSESKKFMDDILRKEWGWEGLVVSDWYGTYSIVESIQAGLDLEMPGPPRWRDAALLHSVSSNKMAAYHIDARVRNLLNLVNRLADSGIKENQEESTRDTAETGALLRRAAAESIVLLKNESNILPLRANKKVAVIGPNSKMVAYCGGGSAALSPYYAISPFDGVKQYHPDVQFAQGCYSHKSLPLLDGQIQTADGKQGFTFRVYNDPPSVQNREPVDEVTVRSSFLFLTDYEQPKLKSVFFYAEVEGYLTPTEDGVWDFGLQTHGTCTFSIDGAIVVDNATNQVAGQSFFGAGTREERGSISLKAGQTYKLFLHFGSAPTSTLSLHGTTAFRKGGLRLGGCPKIDTEEAIERAVTLAESADQVIVFAGLSADWESEGFDRPSMDLPPFTDVLIGRILAVKPDTVVVIQSGTPVNMPWATKCRALVHAWYGGNETGNGIADVLFGKVNPSGKLPLTFPKRIQDNPAYLNYKSESGRIIYGEDIFVGYRYYEKLDLPVLFPFGHGLSYTSFSISSCIVDFHDEKLKVSVSVTNTGDIDGAEVVQVYVSARNLPVVQAIKELKGWKRLR
ncbi:putative beta-glucosidase I [Cadophora sp. MPI-SDFR-AT-0126]|nr:putative beta-glucosidase I [Leotiomycetes sp. MPI-SDFR-AT-0126]